MLQFNNLVITIALLVYIVMYILILRRRNWNYQKHLIFILFYIYILKVFDITFFPLIVLVEDIIRMRNYYSGSYANIVPFSTLLTIYKNFTLSVLLKHIIGNVLMFVPLGFLIPLLKSKELQLKTALTYVLLSSLSIECMQLIYSLLLGFPYRFFDVDDIILNTLGGLIGFLFVRMLFPMIKKYSTLLKDLA